MWALFCAPVCITLLTFALSPSLLVCSSQSRHSAVHTFNNCTVPCAGQYSTCIYSEPIEQLHRKTSAWCHITLHFHNICAGSITHLTLLNGARAQYPSIAEFLILKWRQDPVSFYSRASQSWHSNILRSINRLLDMKGAWPLRIRC